MYYELPDPNYWDQYYRFKGKLFVKSICIINDYIVYKDAMPICYCFN